MAISYNMIDGIIFSLQHFIHNQSQLWSLGTLTDIAPEVLLRQEYDGKVECIIS